MASSKEDAFFLVGGPHLYIRVGWMVDFSPFPPFMSDVKKKDVAARTFRIFVSFV